MRKPRRGPVPMKAARERVEEKRREKLEFVAEQVENGQLIIGQMTEEGRRRYPPIPSEPNVGQRGGTMRQPAGLIARIRQIRRTAEASAAAPRKAAPKDDTIALQLLQARIEHLEQLVEGLQDSIHRESERDGKRITELEARIEPTSLSVALSKDARERGL
jgi:hypothetical protein